VLPDTALAVPGHAWRTLKDRSRRHAWRGTPGRGRNALSPRLNGMQQTAPHHDPVHARASGAGGDERSCSRASQRPL